MGFRVMGKQCETCIYRPGSPMHEQLPRLEAEVTNGEGFVEGWRICHSSEDGDTDQGACCRGFWNKHKDDFPVGQVAQRLGAVEFVDR